MTILPFFLLLCTFVFSNNSSVYIALIGRQPCYDSLSSVLSSYSNYVEEAAQLANNKLVYIQFPEFGTYPQNLLKTCNTQGNSFFTDWCFEKDPYLETFANLAREFQTVISYNYCEKSDNKHYNTQIVLSEQGKSLASYRKMHPFFDSCFDTPQLNLAEFHLSFSGSSKWGVMTCFDIYHSSPAHQLYKDGVVNFIFSSAIPEIFDKPTVDLWTEYYHKAYLFNANLNGDSDIIHQGKHYSADATFEQIDLFLFDKYN